MTLTDYLNLANHKGFDMCARHGALFTNNDGSKGCGRCRVEQSQERGADITLVNPKTGRLFTGKALKARRAEVVTQLLGGAVDALSTATPERLQSCQQGYYSQRNPLYAMDR